MADVLAGVGAAAALMCSTIPWNGPIASVRIGRADGTHIVNPTRSEMKDSDLELIVSGNEETVVMVEGEATCMSESDMIFALKEAHNKIKEIIQLQNELVSTLDVIKDEFGDIQNSKLVEFSKNNNVIIPPHIGGMTIEGQTTAYHWAIDKFRSI